MRRFARWLWLRLTGEDPVIVSGHFRDLSALNEVHCRFLDALAHDHPELQSMIDTHQMERFKAIHPNKVMSDQSQSVGNVAQEDK